MGMPHPSKIAFHSGLLFTASLFVGFDPPSIASSHPVHTIVALLVITGSLLVKSHQTLLSIFTARDSPRESSSWLACLEANPLLSHSVSSNHLLRQLRSREDWKRQLLFSTTVLALCFRVEIARQVLDASECGLIGVEILIPVLLATYDAYSLENISCKAQSNIAEDDLYETLPRFLWRLYSTSRLRYVVPVLLVSYGCSLAFHLAAGVPSTYICSIRSADGWVIPVLQCLAVLLDFFILVAPFRISSPMVKPKQSRNGLPLLWGLIMLASSVPWLGLGLVLYISKPEYRDWLLPVKGAVEIGHLFNLLGYSLLLMILLLLSAYSISQHGSTEAAMLLTTSWTMLPLIKYAWSNQRPFPPLPRMTSLLSVTCILSGFLSFQPGFSRSTILISQRRLHLVMVSLLGVAVMLPVVLKPSITYFHPIDFLLHQAKAQHERFVFEAHHSGTLRDAVLRYQERYKLNPPPGFDKWYQYATAQEASVINIYDQIHNDMLPFWTIPPEQLRHSTWELMSNPWNSIGGISIRSGRASIVLGGPGTHRWMLETTTKMINKFSHLLPDMDLAFNLNDEPRVMVPYSKIEAARHSASRQERLGEGQGWSSDRATRWYTVEEAPYNKTVLQEQSLRSIFHEYQSISCSPTSFARNGQDLGVRPRLCLSCAAPHSLGQIISNWTLAADMCHQPDMAHLHGFYMSPAAFRAANQLVPVFSQGKPQGFNDILYPSPWNYGDKAVYRPTQATGLSNAENLGPDYPDVPFTAKRNVVFWRGTTSEGVSGGQRAWRGMTRQRLVHLANNLTSSTHDTAILLLPLNPVTGDTNDHGKVRFQYTAIPGHEVKSALNLTTDILLAPSVARCGQGIPPHYDDCVDQVVEFQPNAQDVIDFQSHWSYRFLVDVDGAGFSGRFLPFLQSRSLPFRAALFRTWYDERLTAWYHFVPLDNRLHGFWSTFAYFAGVNGTLPAGSEGNGSPLGTGTSILSSWLRRWFSRLGPGKRVEMAPRLREGEMIAEQGRQWAHHTLRKEDMEIYMFRLLLEWGRLTDDNRDKLGFVSGSEE